MPNNDSAQLPKRTQCAAGFWQIFKIVLTAILSCIFGIVVTNIVEPKLVILDKENIEITSIDYNILPNGDYKALHEIRLRLTNRSIAAGWLEEIRIVPDNVSEKEVTIKPIVYDTQRIWFLQKRNIVARYELIFHNCRSDVSSKSDQPVFTFRFYDNYKNPIGDEDLKIRLTH